MLDIRQQIEQAIDPAHGRLCCTTCKHSESDRDGEPCATCIDMMDDTSCLSHDRFALYEEDSQYGNG